MSDPHVCQHVVTRTMNALEWTNSSVVDGEPLGAVRPVKEACHIALPGSAMLLRTLPNAAVLDEMRFHVDPIVIGHGQRLFDDGLDMVSFELVDQQSGPTVCRPGLPAQPAPVR